MSKRRATTVLLLSVCLHLGFLFFFHTDSPELPHDVVIFEPMIYSKKGGGAIFNKKKHQENKTKEIKKLLSSKETNPENFHHHQEHSEKFHEHEAGEHGTGDGTGAGAAAGTDSLKAKFLHELRHRLDELKEYPSISKELGETGVVEVAFTINKSGDIIESHVHKSSGKFRLDQAALKTLSKLKKFQSLPAELKIENLEIIVPLEFDLH